MRKNFLWIFESLWHSGAVETQRQQWQLDTDAKYSDYNLAKAHEL